MAVDLIPCTVRYGFSRSFAVSAQKAFEWCTDYRADDMVLMQEENATREVQHLAEGIIMLVDTFTSGGKSVVKQKLVCLYPDRLMWTSMHITGPNKHSRFLYEITTQANGQSCLRFTALFLDSNVKDGKEAEKLRKELLKMDSENWKLLAKRMEKDLKEN